MTRNRLAAGPAAGAVVAIVAGLVLASCSDDDGGQVSPSSTTTTTTTTAATTTGAGDGAGTATTGTTAAGGTGSTLVLGATTLPPTTAVGAPTTEALQLEPAGLGPVRIGMTVAEVGAALGRRIQSLGGPRAPKCEIYAPEGGPDGVAFLVGGDRLLRVDVIAPGVMTTEGLGLGQTEADAKRRYGGRLTSTASTSSVGGHVLTFAAGNLRLVIETDGKVVTSMRAGQVPEVETFLGC